MVKIQSLIIKAMFALFNLVLVSIIILLLLNNVIIFEVFLALLFVQVLISGYFFFRYLLYKKYQHLAKQMNFDLITTGFLEQARLEGIYKKHWWQIHFASRPYGEYWGVPRTYIKLQFKKERKFNEKILQKYTNYMYQNNKINSVEHVKRPYKNYLLMKVMFFIINKNKLFRLMDFLLSVSKQAQKS